MAFDGLKRSSHAAQEWRGTCADRRQKQVPWEAPVKSFLAAPPRAAHEGPAVRIAGSGSEPDQGQEPMER